MEEENCCCLCVLNIFYTFLYTFYTRRWSVWITWFSAERIHQVARRPLSVIQAVTMCRWWLQQKDSHLSFLIAAVDIIFRNKTCAYTVCKYLYKSKQVQSCWWIRFWMIWWCSPSWDIKRVLGYSRLHIDSNFSIKLSIKSEDWTLQLIFLRSSQVPDVSGRPDQNILNIITNLHTDCCTGFHSCIVWVNVTKSVSLCGLLLLCTTSSRGQKPLILTIQKETVSFQNEIW